jgi:hypothetical protein
MAAAPVAAPVAAPAPVPARAAAPAAAPVVAQVLPPVAVAPMVAPMVAPEVAPVVAPVAVPVAPPVVPAAAPAPRAPVAAGSGAFAQLAASETETAAPQEWDRLRRRLGGLLQAREALTMPAEVAGRTVWRLRTPFASTAEAASFCAEVRAAGGGCWAATGS